MPSRRIIHTKRYGYIIVYRDIYLCNIVYAVGEVCHNKISNYIQLFPDPYFACKGLLRFHYRRLMGCYVTIRCEKLNCIPFIDYFWSVELTVSVDWMDTLRNIA